MRHSLRRVASMVALLLASTFPTLAADVGDPTFPRDLDGMGRAELIYDNIARDLDVTIDGPDYGDELSLEINAWYARTHVDFGPRMTIDFDAGVIGEEYGFYLGGGFRMLFLDREYFRISAVAQAHYSKGVNGVTIGEDGKRLDIDANVIDGDGAILFSSFIRADEERAAVPYIGPLVSMMDLNGYVIDQDTDEQSDLDGNATQIFGGVAGIAFQLPGKSSLRAEARYLDQLNFSLSAGFVF